MILKVFLLSYYDQELVIFKLNSDVNITDNTNLFMN